MCGGKATSLNQFDCIVYPYKQSILIKYDLLTRKKESRQEKILKGLVVIEPTTATDGQIG